MAKKRVFTIKEFLELMEKSAVVKAMKPADIYIVMQYAQDPSSDRAQKIYNILLEEKERLNHVEKKFHEIANKVIDSMGTNLTGMKAKAARQKIEKVQKEVRTIEEKEAEELLRSIE